VPYPDLYIETGEKSDGLVVVLEDGYDKARLEETSMPPFDQRGATEILTVVTELVVVTPLL